MNPRYGSIGVIDPTAASMTAAASRARSSRHRSAWTCTPSGRPSLIPVGTGFKDYQSMGVKYLAEPPQPELLDVEEEIAAAAALAEAAGAEAPDAIGTTIGESKLVAQLLGDESNGKK